MPKRIEENLQFRSELLKRAAKDSEFRGSLRLACKESILFFVNVFCWTYDPRKFEAGLSPKLPFITYPFQDDSFLVLAERGGRHDILIEKSRDMGASWMCMTWMFWRWMFHDNLSFLMVSRKEALVDGSADSLFHHADFLRKNLPIWLCPNFRRHKLKLFNLDNDSKIEGESTTDNIGRGGRRTAILIDEFAAFENGGYEVLSATADTTNSRIFNSTPAGTANAFYAQRQKGTPRLRFHWSLHPEKGRGLYEPRKDGPRIIDTDFWEQYARDDGTYADPADPSKSYFFNPERPKCEEGVRSPWYDRECHRRAHPVEIATQLDIDYQGSAWPYFDGRMLNDLIEKYARPPIHRGILDYGLDSLEPEFMESDDGPLELWIPLVNGKEPPQDREYVVGADISQGTGASNSALSVVDRSNGTKVAALATNRMPETKFAYLAVALAKWFNNARLIWEAQGPGTGFGRTVVEDIHYHQVYFHREETTISRKITQRPGWFSTKEGKNELLRQYRAQLSDETFINPSKEALLECGEYVYNNSGAIVHGDAENTVDPSNKGANHGDRVIADALAAKLVRERKIRQKPKKKGPAIMSFQWRRQKRRRQMAKTDLTDW